MNTNLPNLLATALPGERVVATQPIGDRTLRVELADRRRVVLRLPAEADPQSGDLLAAEATALTALRLEIDLPLPEVLTYAPGRYLVLRHLEGTPLPELAADLSEEQRYALGGELGTLLAQIHGYSAAQYGALQPEHPPELRRVPPTSLREPDAADVDYAHARLTAAITAALAAGEIEERGAAALRAWLAGNLAGAGQSACLVHGDLRPERVLLRRRERGWAIGGLVGWGFAQAWRPGWDHVALLEQFAGPVYFSLRVGYGNAYEAAVERAADQLREFALLPYRLALYLEAGRADLALGLIDADR
jgi:aminoglycoside phosphotransferase (APT) family kinase protein